ncbi:MAG: ATP-dependent 6-phosphofructokinase [Syntrophales bacterium]|nr:ATP-dependent 6-phosphofructokinase [Syntrophales bacterium]
MFTIPTLGNCVIPTPIKTGLFVDDTRSLLFDRYIPGVSGLKETEDPVTMEIAGPRENIYFDPSKVRAAIVTCGGLSPGINDVIRSMVMELYYRYGVLNISGIRYGLQGLIPSYGHPILDLTPDIVKDIHRTGGSILSSSRGDQDVDKIVQSLYRMNINILFCIGGDGTMRAAEKIAGETRKRDVSISVIGIPKTIDNDLSTLDQTFGFDTAISEAVKVIQCAHVESKGAPNGIGLIKIMGRSSGHIAVSATLANNDVNFVLIPEVPFSLQGDKGFLKALEVRLRRSAHAVILVAEGAGQNFNPSREALGTDPSGNVRLFDIGIFLKNEIEVYFKARNIELNLKYIDPSYIIRSVPAAAGDSIYCMLLGQYAVHAGMSGKTAMVVGRYDNQYVHLPLSAVTSRRNVDREGPLWRAALAATGQPPSMLSE